MKPSKEPHAAREPRVVHLSDRSQRVFQATHKRTFLILRLVLISIFQVGEILSSNFVWKIVEDETKCYEMAPKLDRTCLVNPTALLLAR